VVTFFSSDTEEALELLSLSPVHNVSSQRQGGDAQELSSSSGNDLLEDWHKANDIAASIYIVLTTEASSSHASMANAPCGKRKSRTGSSLTQQPRS
jgi:hypothetical protein